MSDWLDVCKIGWLSYFHPDNRVDDDDNDDDDDDDDDKCLLMLIRSN